MTALQSSSQKELQRLVDQIERLETEKKALAADVADKYKEAENKGFDKKVLRRIIAARKKSDAERQSEEAIFDAYSHALGMTGLPLGDYAEKRERELETVQ